MQQCGRLGMDGTMIAMIRPANRPKNTVQIADAREAAKGLKRLLMRFQHVAQPYPVMCLTDLPTAEARPCSC